MKRFFYGVYISDKHISGAFDLIRFILEPDAIRFAHITLRGPYKRQLTASNLARLNANNLTSTIEFRGLGQFKGAQQCTVVVQVDLKGLTSLWYKPDYPDGIAHLTLYDGKDSACASELLALLKKYDWNRAVDVSKLRVIDDKFKIEGSMFDLMSGFLDTYSRFLGSNCVPPTSLANLSVSQRLMLVDKVASSIFRSTSSPAQHAGRNIAA